MDEPSLTEPDFYPLLSKIKVIKTIAETKNMMKKLVLLVESENQDLNVDEQIQTLLQRKELFQLTFIQIWCLDEINQLKLCIEKLRQLQKVQHPNIKGIKEIHASHNQFVIICEHSSYPKLFPFLCN